MLPTAPSRTRGFAAVAAGMLLLAAVVRVGGMESEPPCPTLTGASLAARSVYLKLRPSAAPDWRRAAVEAYMAHATRPAPLVVETIAAGAFMATGRESVWTARALSSLYWLVAAACLIGAARKLTTDAGALLAGAVFLFLPWSIIQSRSFQPDPFAAMCIAAAILAALRFDERQTTGRFLAVALITALAVFTRLMTGLFLLPLFAALQVRRSGLRQAVASWPLWTYGAIAIAPAAIYYLYGFATDPLLSRRTQSALVMSLYFNSTFWILWGQMISTTITATVFVAALAGLWLVPRGRARVVVLSLWAGYLAYGLIFNFHIASHPYYQTMALSAVALSVAGFGRLIDRTPWAVQLSIVAGVVALLWMPAAYRGLLRDPSDPAKVQEYRRIGEVTGHSTNVVMLTECWAMPLRYYGDVGGAFWPTRAEVEVYRPLGEHGIPDIGPAERLDTLSRSIGGAKYFVITDLGELGRQPDLQRYLSDRFSVLSQSPRSIIYDIGSGK